MKFFSLKNFCGMFGISPKPLTKETVLRPLKGGAGVNAILDFDVFDLLRKERLPQGWSLTPFQSDSYYSHHRSISVKFRDTFIFAILYHDWYGSADINSDLEDLEMLRGFVPEMAFLLDRAAALQRNLEKTT